MSFKNAINYGVIPAAGAGKRMGYIGELLPKCLLPLGNQPILHYVINQMENIGVEKIFIIIENHKKKIRDYIESVKKDIKPEIFFVEQKELNGTAAAILLIEQYIQEPFICIWGDDFTMVDSLDGMVDLFFKTKAVVVKGMVQEDNIQILKDTCCAQLERDGRMIEIIDKPIDPPYKLRGCGVFIFSPEIFDYIRKTPLVKIKKILEIIPAVNLVAQDKKAYGYMLNGDNVNINNLDNLIEANLLLRKHQKNK